MFDIRKDGLRAATNYAMMCTILGDKWLKYDRWTKTTKYMYVIQRRTERMTEACATGV